MSLRFFVSVSFGLLMVLKKAQEKNSLAKWPPFKRPPVQEDLTSLLELMEKMRPCSGQHANHTSLSAKWHDETPHAVKVSRCATNKSSSLVGRVATLELGMLYNMVSVPHAAPE